LRGIREDDPRISLRTKRSTVLAATSLLDPPKNPEAR